MTPRASSRQDDDTDEERVALDRDGFVVLRDVFAQTTIGAILHEVESAIEAARNSGTWNPGGTASLPDLLNAPITSAAVGASTQLRDAVAQLVGDDHVLMRINYRAPQPGFGAQALHTDFHTPAQGGKSLVATAIVALTDFDEQNGATRVVPGSHRLPHLRVPKQSGLRYPDERIVCCSAGSAIALSGHLWHSGTQNRSQAPRHALQISYARKGIEAAHYGLASRP